MISKGTTHNNGVRLAQYITTGKDNERAELWQLRGFSAANIMDAFRDIHVMAGATKCEKPFFHVQVRNRENETLTRPQWEIAADRIERILGLSDQPRAIAFHIDEKTAAEHMHVVWSRIDQDELTARPLPFFHRRLKTISRELELEFGLEAVTNNRKDQIRFAPTRAEEEQARRLGIDIHETRKLIRTCYERSDCGRSFEAALYQEGLILAKGEKRDFLVIDREGGMHALGKRILDVSASQVRHRLADLSRDSLPTVSEARENQVGKQLSEILRPEPQPMLDRDAANIAWEDELARAAIKKERKEMRFMEPGSRTPTPAEERVWPTLPQTPAPIHTSPDFHFEDAAQATTKNLVYRPPIEKKLSGMTKQIISIIETLEQRPREQKKVEGKSLREVFDFRGMALAKVTNEEAEKSHREASFARELGNFAPRYKEGEIVAIRKSPVEYRRRDGSITDPIRVYRLDQVKAQEFVLALGAETKLEGIHKTKAAIANKPLGQLKDWEKIRLKNAQTIRDFSRKTKTSRRPPREKAGKATSKAIDSVLGIMGGFVDSLFASTPTPEKERQARNAKSERESDAELTIEIDHYSGAAALERRRSEDRLRDDQRERERSGRER
jgi:hypothetical protein